MTLIEVMMSTMVVSLGILGLVALIPLGTHLTERGTRADRIAIVGERAFHEARIRGYFDPSRWIAPNTPPFTGTGPRFWEQTEGDFPLPLRQPYMIDPMFFPPDNSGTSTVYHDSRRFFPYTTKLSYGIDMTDDDRQHTTLAKPVRMLRLSVSPQPASDDPLSIPEARMAFESEDDLAFERPSDGEAPPIQSFYTRDAVKGTNNHNTSGVSTNRDGEIRRQAAGEYTWMIMLTPEPLDLYRVAPFAPTVPPNPPTLSAAQAAWMHPPINTAASGSNSVMTGILNAAATNEYVASVLILKNRQGTIPTGAVPSGGVTSGSDERWQTNERILRVDPSSFVAASGGATGEIQIVQYGGTREDAEERTLKASNGDWICLVRRMPSHDYNPPGTGTNTRRLPRGDVYLWYKIVMVDEVVDSTGSPTGTTAPFTRYLTLSGPDWPVDNDSTVSNREPLQPTHAIMVEGVVGVYTRNVRLQTPNLWTP
ncbi:hypothetical protein C5Y93_28475 [Blastopirellula marina]|uniref:Uncharacterized protein n=1 Tax=Blastopirellula marina TaxID=124 RepID=A0A2S8GCW8_9BACT|nr:hypothetical protein C5Y93_28475 [Blastopirellula marina]